MFLGSLLCCGLVFIILGRFSCFWGRLYCFGPFLVFGNRFLVFGELDYFYVFSPAKYVKTNKNGRKEEERPQKKKNVPKTIKTAGIIVILIAPLSHASIPAPEISGALL